MEGYIYCGLCIISFVIGAIVGQSSKKDRNITLNPIKAIKENIQESKEKKEETLRVKKMNTILTNIDNYDGTGSGQSEIPR